MNTKCRQAIISTSFLALIVVEFFLHPSAFVTEHVRNKLLKEIRTYSWYKLLFSMLPDFWRHRLIYT